MKSIKKISSSFRQNSCQGFSYVEVLIAMIIISTCLVPAMYSLRNATSPLGFQEEMITDQLALFAKTEEVLKEPYANLDAAAIAAGGPTIATTYSDAVPYVTNTGRELTRLVYISSFDGDNVDLDNNPFTGTDAGLLYIKVQIEDTDQFNETLVNW